MRRSLFWFTDDGSVGNTSGTFRDDKMGAIREDSRYLEWRHEYVRCMGTIRQDMLPCDSVGKFNRMFDD